MHVLSLLLSPQSATRNPQTRQWKVLLLAHFGRGTFLWPYIRSMSTPHVNFGLDSRLHGLETVDSGGFVLGIRQKSVVAFASRQRCLLNDDHDTDEAMSTYNEWAKYQ